MLLEKQLSEKQEAEKDDANAKYVKGKIHEISESNEFGNFGGIYVQVSLQPPSGSVATSIKTNETSTRRPSRTYRNFSTT